MTEVILKLPLSIDKYQGVQCVTCIYDCYLSCSFYDGYRRKYQVSSIKGCLLRCDYGLIEHPRDSENVL